MSHSIRALWRYRWAIFLGIAAVAIATAIGLILAYFISPSQRVTTLPFRLDFEGAERGQYPNGVKFSSAEIVATPVLGAVYRENDLGRFASLQTFKEAIFVVESNAALDQLTREYRAKLSDPKLSAVDRERLEREFQMKRDSLSKAEFSINFVPIGDAASIPSTLVLKSLDDILQEWARSAAEEKGVIRYRLPVLSRNILDRNVLKSSDSIIATDALRTRIENVVRNISTLLGVPGAEVLRSGQDGVSLEELRLRLNDLSRFRVQPLNVLIRTSGGTPSPTATMRYLESQLEYNQQQATAAEEEAEAMRQAFNLYTAQASTRRTDAVAIPRPEGTGDTLMPQISDSFLDRLIALTQQSADREYRQEFVDGIAEAEVAVIPYRQETNYYQRTIENMRGLQAAPTTDAAIQAELTSIYSDLETAIVQLNDIYRILSRNLHPSTTLYTITGPAATRVDRAVSVVRLGLYGLLVILLAIPLILAAALVHNRVKKEERMEERWLERAESARSATEGIGPEYSSGQ